MNSPDLERFEILGEGSFTCRACGATIKVISVNQIDATRPLPPHCDVSGLSFNMLKAQFQKHVLDECPRGGIIWPPALPRGEAGYEKS